LNQLHVTDSHITVHSTSPTYLQWARKVYATAAEK
jgi:hypothetical protein